MSMQDSALATTVTTLLTSDPAMRGIYFTIKNVNISALTYFSVSALIQNGRIKCKVDPAQIDAGAAAMYDPKANVIFGKDARLALLDEKASMVHEATHACIDMMFGVKPRGSRGLRNLENETAAYLAGAIYSVTSKRLNAKPGGVKVTISNAAMDITDVAEAAVKAKGFGSVPTGAPTMINFTDQDVLALQTSIKKNKLYLKSWMNTSQMDAM